MVLDVSGLTSYRGASRSEIAGEHNGGLAPCGFAAAPVDAPPIENSSLSWQGH